ncbi:MAG: hypothetical protein AAF152_18525 [Cyanobacteria bacterium P01_A01_bin.114]
MTRKVISRLRQLFRLIQQGFTLISRRLSGRDPQAYRLLAQQLVDLDARHRQLQQALAAERSQVQQALADRTQVQQKLSEHKRQQQILTIENEQLKQALAAFTQQQQALTDHEQRQQTLTIENERLQQALTEAAQRQQALTIEREQLRQELNDLYDYSGRELQKLKSQIEALQKQAEDLQLNIFEVEDERDALLAQLASLPPETPEIPKTRQAETVEISATKADLSKLHLALVGGHDATRREVIKELSTQYGLNAKKCIELPPFDHGSLGKSRIKSKIQHCDLIVIITGYINHKQTDSINRLRDKGALSGEVLPINCRGKSGVVRQILDYVA